MAKLDKLITYAYLKEEVDLPQNLDDSELEHPIYRAQETLRMLMTDEFYQDFLTNYKNGTLSVVYDATFPYLKQFIAWQAYEFWVPRANFKVTRAGFRVHKEDHSEPAPEANMAFIIKDAKAQSQYYKNLLIGFLDNHYQDYPLYATDCRPKNSGNSFKISAVKNKHRQPDPYGTGTYKKFR
jgi:hypothetical protein